MDLSKKSWNHRRKQGIGQMNRFDTTGVILRKNTLLSIDRNTEEISISEKTLSMIKIEFICAKYKIQAWDLIEPDKIPPTCPAPIHPGSLFVARMHEAMTSLSEDTNQPLSYVYKAISKHALRVVKGKSPGGTKLLDSVCEKILTPPWLFFNPTHRFVFHEEIIERVKKDALRKGKEGY